ncbi:MAG: hypothetical protein WBA76_20965, partial [Phormidesmis sp.]
MRVSPALLACFSLVAIANLPAQAAESSLGKLLNGISQPAEAASVNTAQLQDDIPITPERPPVGNPVLPPAPEDAPPNDSLIEIPINPQDGDAEVEVVDPVNSNPDVDIDVVEPAEAGT